jgi:hypothetical protein
MWDEIAKSIVKDVLVAVGSAAALAILRRFLPFLPGKVRESDKGTLYRNAAPAEPKSFAQDVALYVFRILFILVTISGTLTFVLPSHDLPNLNQARYVGRFLPSVDLNLNGAFFKLALLTLVPFVVAERVLCLFFWWLGSTKGYTSTEFRQGTMFFVITALCFALSAHLIFVFSPVDYATAWTRGAIGWGVLLAASAVAQSLKKKSAGRRAD